jgi:hypothetical protein
MVIDSPRYFIVIMQSEYPQLHKNRTGIVRNVVNRDNSIRVYLCVHYHFIPDASELHITLLAACEFDIRIIYLAKYRDDGSKGT